MARPRLHECPQCGYRQEVYDGTKPLAQIRCTKCTFICDYTPPETEPSFEEFPKVDDESHMPPVILEEDEELTDEFFENAVLSGPGESLIEAIDSGTESQLKDMTVRFNKANATIIEKNLHIKQLEDLLRRYLP